MAKKKIEIDDSMEMFDPVASASKLPTDIQQGKLPRQDYMDIPVGLFVPFGGKQGGDFTRLPDDQFERLVETVRKEGVVEATVVRPLPDGRFELIAGETRWRASVAAGLETCPARILSDCDDDRAARLFVITNLNRRETSIADKLYGWHIYWESTKAEYRGRLDDQLKEDTSTVYDTSDSNLQTRQIIKYHKVYLMPDIWKQKLANREVGLDAAYTISFLKPGEQEMLLSERISVSQSRQLRELSDSGKWSASAVHAILHGEPNPQHELYTKQVKAAVKNFKKTMSSQLDPALYGQIGEVMNEALELYFKAHPDAKVRS